MRTEGGLAEAETLADDECEDQTGHTRVDVNDCATGEVDRSDVGDGDSVVIDRGAEELCRDAVLGTREESATPHHVREREVDDGDPDTREQEPGAELDPLGQGTTDEGGGDDRERHLERDVDDVGVAPGAGDEVAVSIGDAVLEAEELERVGKKCPRCSQSRRTSTIPTERR